MSRAYGILISMKKLLIALLLSLLPFAFYLKPVYSAGEFNTSISTTYQFDDTGAATIVHNIDLINNLSHIYPTTYNLSISSGDIEDIEVSVMGDSVSPEIDQQPSVTSLHIPIRNPKIGKDQTTILTISYATKSFAEKIGDTVTLTLPKTAKGNEAESFVRKVLVPTSYPELSYSSQGAQTTSTEGDQRVYQFVGSGDQNLTLHFGKSASYDLKLNYLLKNTTSIEALSELALPPDTAYQRVILNKLDPKPKEVVVDSDGNWLARYQLGALSKLEVTAEVSVIVSPNPIYFDPSSSTPLGEELYWEHGSSVKRLAANLKNPENLYNYLLETFSYDFTQITRAKRLGVEEALTNPSSAICTEFTDVFVATSRSMGIPSRAIIGYAVTSNSALRPQGSDVDILHAYPEYQDPSTKVWRSIDPTWGHTTGGSEYFDLLDFGHITFVRWGASSSYPLPAGSYRESRAGRQINVTVRDTTLEFPETSFKVETVGETNYLVNKGTHAIVKETLRVSDHDVFVPYLPPYGRQQLSNFSSSSSLMSLITNNIKYLIIFALALVASIIYLLWKKRHHK